MTRPRVLLEGVGGIGGIIAARMIQNGCDPLLVTNNKAITDAINNDGIRAKTLRDEFRVSARAVTTLEEIETGEKYDVALLVMKANNVEEAAEKTLPVLSEDGFVVTLQNGIVEEAVAKIVGPHRIVSGIVVWGGTFHAPGVYEKTGPGNIYLGEWAGQNGARVKSVERILAFSSPVVVTENIRGALWSKLAINCVITSTGALSGLTLGEMLRQRAARDVFLGLYREVFETALAAEITLETMAANPRLLYLPAGAGFFKRTIKDLLVQALGRKYHGLRSSSLQSLERGRKTEVKFLNGYVVEQAHRLNLELPLNQALVKMITEIESGARKISPQNLEELATLL